MAAAAAAAPAPAPAPARTADTKLPKPEPFMGNRNKLRSFLRKLRLQCSVIPNAQGRLRYAVSCLEDAAYDQIAPYVEDTRVNLTDLADLIAILETAFGN